MLFVIIFLLSLGYWALNSYFRDPSEVKIQYDNMMVGIIGGILSAILVISYQNFFFYKNKSLKNIKKK